MINYKWVRGIALLLICIFSYGCSLTGQSGSDANAALKRPNIVFILADDMGYGDLSAFNPLSKIPTPHINSMAERGMRCTDAHSAAPWCIPSRYGFLTGLYPYNINTNWDETSLIHSSQVTIASMLKDNGYKTGMVGKWHEGFNDFKKWIDEGGKGRLAGGPVDLGFDYYFGVPASLDLPPYFYIENDYAVKPPTGFIASSHSVGLADVQGRFWRKGKIAAGFNHEDVLPTLTKKAIHFIKQNALENKPFFLYYALTAPHTPWLPSEEFKGKSGAGLYGDFVMQVDDVVGQINDVLKENGIERNTLVIFTSDNGPVWFQHNIDKTGHRSAGLLSGIKFDSWEGGHRIPFIVKWPAKIKAGSYSNALIDLTDMMATFAAVSGGDLSNRNSRSEESSMNQMPVFMGQKATVRKIMPNANSIRNGQWKLIIGNGWTKFQKAHEPEKEFKQSKFELYNLKADIFERNNLFKQYPVKVEQLTALYDSIKPDK